MESLRAQSMEVSAIGGLGPTVGSQAPRFTTGGGASAAWSSSQGLKLDYFFANTRGNDFKRHFLTVSYVVQRRSGAARPFFQIGAGLLHGNRKDTLNAPSGGTNSVAAIIGGGLTFDVGHAFFIRPELRSYWYTGPSATVLPSVSAGWRF